MNDNKNAELSPEKENATSSQTLSGQEAKEENISGHKQAEQSLQQNITSDENTSKEDVPEMKKVNAKSELNESVQENNETILNILQADTKVNDKTDSEPINSDDRAAASQKESNHLSDDDNASLAAEKSPSKQSSSTKEKTDTAEAKEASVHDEMQTDIDHSYEEATQKESKASQSASKQKQTEAKKDHEGKAASEKLSQSQPLTIEEKRRQQRENKMTIEEKRQLQKNQALPPCERSFVRNLLKEYFQHTDRWDRICLIVLLLSEVMTIYISMQVMRYLRAIYGIGIFLVLTITILAIFWFMTKKKRIAYCCSGILALLLVIGSFGAYRMATFGSHVFNNVETETVMIVTSKDSKLMPSSDFTRKKMAVFENDGELNNFAREILREEKKSGYQEVAYSSYQEAYTDMQEGRIDLMIYDAQIQKYLEEKGIDSGTHIKVLFEKTFQREAIKSKAVDISKDPFNVYISGVDLTSRGINEKGSSDVNIILTVNPKTKKMIMQTIPRDSWVPITCMNDRHSKLTYAGAYGGIDCSIRTIEKTYGITINYYAKINFQGVIDLVDALGGVTIMSDVGFCESHPFEGYGVRDYCYAAGANEVDGIHALMFSRIRRVFSEGDIERGRHQMALVEAVMNKFVQEPTMEHINGLLMAVQNNFTTNLAETDMGKALSLFLRMQDQLQNIKTYTMKGELLWDDDEIRNEYLYYFYPNDGEITEFQQRIRDVMEGK